MQSSDILTIARDTLRRESASVASLCDQLDEEFVRAAETLLDCRSHVLVGGAGTSRAVGERLAHLLSCCGTPALFIHPGDSQHGLSGAVRPDDVLFLLSKGGETNEVNFLAKHAKKVGATVIGLMEKTDSTLGRLSDIVLKVTPDNGVDPYGMIATGSSLTTSAFCDALCVTLLELRGYTKENFGQTHPGGAVGHQLAQSGIGQ